MPSTVTIKVNNLTSSPEAFQIFNAPPTDSGLPNTVYINTWGTAPEVDAKTGQAEFQITEQYYAICGGAPAALSKGLVVSTTNFEDATLGTGSNGSDWQVDIPPGQGQAPIFTGSDKADSDVKGGFTISTTGDTWNPDDYPTRFCGLGRDTPLVGQTGVVPVAVWAPNPNQKYPVTPFRTYYIAYGNTLTGLQAAVSDLGTPVTIDFTGRTETNCTVDLNPNFSWSTPQFSP